ncbi:hypothetical protein BZG35_09580 [Brevundimonas sp. LM2]|uniref:Atu4866 domain-containing protein n=1 Tax=Brevundimonas sp. LM2 TaxID=1938605 RepID=UPI000983BFA0|nr:Atu4866 domain-containing protein [Brevundimonas sp. LM2]AQR61873.1 hypothetical protein BZG35_09580 [Brevundimonas sp. LM2]
MRATFAAASALAVVALVAGATSPKTMIPATQRAEAKQQEAKGPLMTQHPYVGMWVTADGHIRQELLLNGRYDEARGSRQSAYQGRYAVRGTHIDYWDDTGFTADGTFVNEDELHHGGMIFYRERD